MHHLQDVGPAHLPEFSASSLLGADPHFVIRRLGPRDEPDMAKLLRRLDLQARLDRFGHDMGDAALDAYAQQCAGQPDSQAFAFAQDRPLLVPFRIADINYWLPR